MSQDRRGEPRARTTIEIQFRDNSSFVRAYMLNVSNGGIFIKTDSPLMIDTKVTLVVTLPDEAEAFEAEGMVVWTNPRATKNSFPKGMGIKFTHLPQEYAEKIEAFVQEHLEEIQDHSLM